MSSWLMSRHRRCWIFSRTEGSHSRRRSCTDANFESCRCQSGKLPKASVSPYWKRSVRSILPAGFRSAHLIELAVITADKFAEIAIHCRKHRLP